MESVKGVVLWRRENFHYRKSCHEGEKKGEDDFKASVYMMAHALNTVFPRLFNSFMTVTREEVNVNEKKLGELIEGGGGTFHRKAHHHHHRLLILSPFDVLENC